MKDAQVTEAVYTGGVLKPVRPLDLREAQRVRITVQAVDETEAGDREAAFRRLLAGIDRMNFAFGGRLPQRDELHDCS
jgi:predicted DNA-binding antitoxin AbrB/MazE fold protein